jgi:hypothetical protein
MRSVDGRKKAVIANNSEGRRKPHSAAAAIAAKTATAIGIIEVHIKILSVIARGLDQNQTVGTDTKMPITKRDYLGGLELVLHFAIIHYNEVIARALVFCKVNLHPAKIVTKTTGFPRYIRP